MNNHIWLAHDAPFERCDHCSFRTRYISRMHTHVERVHDNIYYDPCNLCNYAAQNKGDLKKHINGRHYHRINKRLYYKEYNTLYCSICNKKMDSIADLRKHKKAHIPIRNCNKCSYSSYNACAMKRHMKRWHDQIFDIFCDSCDYSTHSEDLLRSHIERKHNACYRGSLRAYKKRVQKCSNKTMAQIIHIETVADIETIKNDEFNDPLEERS